jgi:hypothetical protein
MDFWVTSAGRKPVGPVTEALVVQGIDAGMIPSEAFVCEVGGDAWRPIADVAAFAAAIARRRAKRAAASDGDRTAIENYPLIPSEPPLSLQKVDDTDDRTVADSEPRLESEVPPRRTLPPFDDADEKTLVDIKPPPASDPPR